MNKITRSTCRIANSVASAGLIGALAMLLAACLPIPPGENRAQPSEPAAPVASPSPVAAASPVAPPAAAPASPPPPPPILAFDDAVSAAAHKVFAGAPTPDGAAAVIVIDPLVDGMTGYQSKATKSIQDRIAVVVKSDFPQYVVKRITPDNLKPGPRILVGTFTPVNAQMKTAGAREAYRFCLVMGDLQTGKIVAKSVARARIEGPDASPTATFADSPVWTTDSSVEAYVATCQASKVGDPIKQEYIEGLQAASLVSEASDAYDEGHYQEALDLYETALKTPAGDQLRVHNGIYLSESRLGNSEKATAAFRELVEYGLRKKRLAVKFLFRPGSVRFAADNQFSGSYGMWLQQIASETSTSHRCLQVTGHTSPSGPAALNDTLSLLRAEYIQSRLEGDAPALKNRTVAAGVGSRENLIGTGKDDKTDELDRRVELKPIDPCG